MATTAPDSRETYLTVTQVCETLAISRPTLYSLLQRGDLPHIRIGRVFRIPQSSLASLVTTKAAAGK
jgi:excisionase family DNA binding protein